MRLEQLTYVVEIAQSQSLSKTAEKLHISHSALSVALKQLESELGRILFKRTSRGLFLTSEGQQIHAQIVQVLATIKEWYAAPQTETVCGEIHIACPPIVSRCLTASVIVPFRRLHPDATIFMHNMRPQDTLQILKNSKANMVIAAFSEAEGLMQRIRDRNLEAEHLFSDERRLFLGAGHPLARKDPLLRDDLKTLHLAYYSDSQDQVSKTFEPCFASAYRLANREDILELVMRNEAAFITSYHLFKSDFRVRQGLLLSRPLPFAHKHCHSDILAVRLPELSHAEQAFWDFLLLHFADDL